MDTITTKSKHPISFQYRQNLSEKKSNILFRAQNDIIAYRDCKNNSHCTCHRCGDTLTLKHLLWECMNNRPPSQHLRTELKNINKRNGTNIKLTWEVHNRSNVFGVRGDTNNETWKWLIQNHGKDTTLKTIAELQNTCSIYIAEQLKDFNLATYKRRRGQSDDNIT
jgi:hypothetical protein